MPAQSLDPPKRTPSFVCEVPRPSQPCPGTDAARPAGGRPPGVQRLPGGSAPTRAAGTRVQSLSARQNLAPRRPRAQGALSRGARPARQIASMRCMPTPSSLATAGSGSIWTASRSSSSPHGPSAPPIGCWWGKPAGCGSKADTNWTPSKARPTRAVSAGAGTGWSGKGWCCLPGSIPVTSCRAMAWRAR